MLKWRFAILQEGRKGFSIRTQIKIVYACVALHNWLNIYGGDFKEIARQVTKGDLVGGAVEDTGGEALPDGLTDDELRDEIAELMWEYYL